MARTKKHPGSISLRSPGVWRIRLCVTERQGESKYHSFTVHGTKVEAQNFATEKYAELAKDVQRTADGLALPPSFSGLVDLYRTQELVSRAEGTQRSYNDSFKPFSVYFVDQLGDPRVDQIRRAHIKGYLAWRRDTPYGRNKKAVSKHTVARDLRVLKLLFGFALEMDYIEANPCERVESPKADPRTPHILSADEYERLLSACEGRSMLQLYVLTLAETGCRSYSEALRLRWEDVDLSEGFVQIRSGREGQRTKSGKSRWTPMTPRLRDAMREHFAKYRLGIYHGQRSAYVFHHTRDRQRSKAGEQIKSLRRAFRAATTRAKVPAVRLHDLRHRRVTTWLAEGKSPALVQEAMGHSSIATTLGYKHLAREHLRALVEPTASPVRKAEGA
jgi:integrase/recombinase XerD